jgi:cytoskeletal protein RodZ
MPSSDLKDVIDWANKATDSSSKSSNWGSWLPVLFIVVLLVLAAWWWWVNYGQRRDTTITNSSTFNDLKVGARADNPLLVRPNGRVVSG